MIVIELGHLRTISITLSRHRRSAAGGPGCVAGDIGPGNGDIGSGIGSNWEIGIWKVGCSPGLRSIAFAGPGPTGGTGCGAGCGIMGPGVGDGLCGSINGPVTPTIGGGGGVIGGGGTGKCPGPVGGGPLTGIIGPGSMPPN